MVLLHVKRSDSDQFLLEVPAAALGSDALTLAVRICNLRHRLLSLCEDGAELLRSGPAQQPQEEGVDSDEEPESNLAGVVSGGAVSSKEAALRSERGTAGAKKEQVARGVALTEAALLGALDAVRGAVLAAFPSGLPPRDPVRRGIEGAAQGRGREVLEPEAAELWFAGRPLAPDAPLSARLGRNDKTRVVLRLQRLGQGAPAREPVVDEETHKAMLAWHFKKQAQQKKLAEDDGTTFYDSAWADPKALKQHFSGVRSVRLG